MGTHKERNKIHTKYKTMAYAVNPRYSGHLTVYNFEYLEMLRQWEYFIVRKLLKRKNPNISVKTVMLWNSSTTNLGFVKGWRGNHLLIFYTNIYCRSRNTLYPQKLALILQTSGGRLVGIVRLRTNATEFIILFIVIIQNVRTNFSLKAAGCRQTGWRRYLPGYAFSVWVRLYVS
jgi:hypothetical protein